MAEKIRKCPICGKSFEVSQNTRKYCSADCRRKMLRKNVDEKHLQEIEAISERQKKQWSDYQEKLKAEKTAEEKALKKRASEGDPEALMKLSDNSHDYWKYFALWMIQQSERDFGRKSTFTVNDVSVYAPDFAELVVDSIERTGRCIQKDNGLGEKFPTK